MAKDGCALPDATETAVTCARGVDTARHGMGNDDCVCEIDEKCQKQAREIREKKASTDVVQKETVHRLPSPSKTCIC